MTLSGDFVFEFRDGARSVPPHLAPLFEEFDTQLVTYEEAVQYVNQSMQRHYLDKAQDDAVRQHFVRFPKT